MIKKPKAIINVISNWSSLVLNVIAGFFITPFIIVHIGKAGFGIWTLIFSFIGYYGIFETALIPAIIHYIARSIGEKNKTALNETASTAMVIFFCIGIFVVLVCFIVASPLSDLMNITPDNKDTFVFIIWILGISMGIKFPCAVLGAIVNAHEQWVAYNVTIILRIITRVLLTVILLAAGLGIKGLAYATLASTIIELITNYIVYKRYIHGIAISLKSAKLKILRIILIYAGIMIIIKLSNLIRFNLDSFVIGKMIGIEEIAIYRIAALLMEYTGTLVFAAMKVLDPRFSKLYGAGEKEGIKNLFLRAFTISSFFSYGIILLVFILGTRFVLFWVGVDFKGAIPVLWILLAAYAIELPQTPAGSVLKSINKHYILAIAQIIEALVNLVISIILAPRLGIIGVALGTAIPMTIVKVFVQPIYVSKILKINIFKYFKSMVIHGSIMACIVSFVFITNIFTIDFFTTMNPILFFFFAGSITIGLYLLASLLLMPKADRSYLFSLIRFSGKKK